MTLCRFRCLRRAESDLGRDACRETGSELPRKGGAPAPFRDVGFAGQAWRFGKLRCRLRGCRLRDRRSIFGNAGTRVAKHMKSGRGRLAISGNEQRFCNVKFDVRCRRSTFARSVAGRALAIRYRFRGRRSAFARLGTDFGGGVALLQGQVLIDRGRRSTFARSGTDFVSREACGE